MYEDEISSNGCAARTFDSQNGEMIDVHPIVGFAVIILTDFEFVAVQFQIITAGQKRTAEKYNHETDDTCARVSDLRVIPDDERNKTRDKETQKKKPQIRSVSGEI